MKATNRTWIVELIVDVQDFEHCSVWEPLRRTSIFFMMSNQKGTESLFIQL